MVLNKLFPGGARNGRATTQSRRKTTSPYEKELGPVDLDDLFLPNHIINNGADDVSSIHVGGSVTVPRVRQKKVRRSPRSVKDLDSFLPSTCSSEPQSSRPTGPKAGHHNQVFANLDLMLNKISEEKDEGVEVDALTASDLHSTNGHREIYEKALSGVELFRKGHDTPTVTFDDMRIFSLSLVGHANEKIAQNITRKSWQRHLDFYFEERKKNDAEAGGSRGKKGMDKNATKDNMDKAEKVAQKLMAEKRYDKAIKSYKKLAESQKKNPNSARADTLGKLAILYFLVGNTREALSYAKRALDLNREESRRLQATISMVLLGQIYFGCGKIEKSLRTWREALQIACLVCGYDHPYVAILLNNLGCLHYIRSDYATSLTLFSESLDLNRKFLNSSLGGTDALLLDISYSKGNVAVVNASNETVDAAVCLLEEVLSLQESVVYDSAQKVIEDTNSILQKLASRLEAGATSTAGASGEHRGTAGSAALHAPGIVKQKQIEDVKPSVFGNSDGIPLRRSGSKSPVDAIDSTDVLDVLLFGSLEEEYSPKQRVRAAVLGCFERTLQEQEGDGGLPFVASQGTPRKRTRIPIDLDKGTVIDAELCLQFINEQAADHLEHDEIDEALELFRSALSSHRDKYGNAHHLVGTAHHNIAMVYLFAQNYSKAMAFFQEAVAVRGAALGSEHPAVASSLMKIGMIFLLLRNPDSAKGAFERVLKVVRKSLGHGHIAVARVLNNIAVAQYDLGSHVDAFRTLQEAYDIQRRLLELAISEGSVMGKSQVRTIEFALMNTLSNLGFLYCRQNKSEDALSMFQEADKLRIANSGELTPDNSCVEENLHYVEMLEEERLSGRNGEWRLQRLVNNISSNTLCK